MIGPRTPLRRWRFLRAAVLAFMIVRLCGGMSGAGGMPRRILAILAVVIAFGLLLRFERFVQDKREEAERTSGH